MKPEGEIGAGRTLEQSRLVRGRTTATTFGLLARCGLLFVCGCPQLLDDDFIRVEGAAGASAEPGVGGSGGAGGAGPITPVPPGAVVVWSAVPDEGALGVLPDAALVFKFSAPMNTTSVEAAYVSSDLPPGLVSFAWSEADTVLTIQPEAALRVAVGAASALVAPATYTLELSSQAQDKVGNALVAKRVSFSVVRSLTQTSSAVQDRDLTGNWRADGNYGVADCERGDATICVGDSISSGEPGYRALLTFDLSVLPRDLIAIQAAELGVTVSAAYGTPFDDLGTLQVEHVTFSSIGDAAYASPALSARKLMSSGAAAGERMSASVLADVQADWGTRDQSQFRLAFDTATNSDGAADLLICDGETAQLGLTYWLP